MKCWIWITNEITKKETIENVLYSDEIAETEAMDDDEFARMENELKTRGHYWLSSLRCVRCEK